MKYPHIVIKNGKWYAAGEEVPDTVPGNKPAGYTKTEINRMPTAELQSLAAQNGIKNAAEMSGVDLKAILIEKLGL